MKKIILSSFLALATLPMFAQDVPGTVPQVAPAVTMNPEFIQFKVTAHDFGNVKQNIPVSYTFEFKNVGTKDITLVNVQASCGCTTPNWKGGIYKPGETAQITATFNAASEGYFQKNVTVTTSEGVNSLTISGMVMAPAAYEDWKIKQDSIDLAKAKLEKGESKGKKSEKKSGKSSKDKDEHKSKDADRPKSKKSSDKKSS